MIAEKNEKIDGLEVVKERDLGQPLLLSASSAAALLSIGRTLFYGLNSSGRLPAPVKLGGRVLWRRSELEQWTTAGCPVREKWNQLKNG